MYSFHIGNDKDLSKIEVKVAKGVKNAITAEELRFHDILKCLLENNLTHFQMYTKHSS